VSGDTLYRRTQIAWPVVVPVAFVSLLLTWTIVQTEFEVGLGIALAVLLVSLLLVILLLFGTLTVTVTNDGLLAAFGVGLVRKRVAFGDVVSFARVRTNWTNGFGIHGYPGGMLYNASGPSAIEFRLANGRYVGIGTAEPDAFADAVRRAIGKSESSSHEPAAQRKSTAGVVAVVIGVSGLAFPAVILVLALRPPVVRLTDEAFEASGPIYSSTVAYSAMRSATLEDAIPRIRLRTNGSAVGSTLRGSFNVEGWGNGRLYINRDVPPFVVIRTSNTFVVVNFKEPQRTRDLYADLTARINRGHG
jgi:hypothetical protein